MPINSKPATRLFKHECAGLFSKISSSQVSLPDKPSVDLSQQQSNINWRDGQGELHLCRGSDCPPSEWRVTPAGKRRPLSETMIQLPEQTRLGVFSYRFAVDHRGFAAPHRHFPSLHHQLLPVNLRLILDAGSSILFGVHITHIHCQSTQ